MKNFTNLLVMSILSLEHDGKEEKMRKTQKKH